MAASDIKVQLAKFIEPFKKLDLKAIVKKVLKNHRRKLIEVQRKQLMRGEKSTEAQILPPYKPSTVRKKQRKGQPVDRVTLRDTGKFYRYIHPVFHKENFTMRSNDMKMYWLERKYGNDILGIQEKEAKKIAAEIQAEITREIVNALKRS